MKCNKTKCSVNTYPSPSKATTKVDSTTHVKVLRSDEDSNNLSKIDTLHQQDSKNFVQKIRKNTQSELTAELLDPELSGALLNSVSSAFNSKQEGRVTAVVAKAKYHTATENQARRDSNTLLGVAPVIQSSRPY